MGRWGGLGRRRRERRSAGADECGIMKTLHSLLFPSTALASLLACAAVPLHAQMDSPAPAPTEMLAGSPADDATRDFLKEAAESGMKEVMVARSVRPHLKNADVIAFSREMENAHSKVNGKLQDLARQKGVPLPQADTDVAEDWAENTHDTDEDYVDEMIDDHQDAIALFQEATKNRDPQIAKFAADCLPELQRHLAEAKRLKEQVD